MEIRRRQKRDDPLFIEMDPAHEAELRWFYTSPDPEAEDAARYDEVLACFGREDWWSRERDAYGKTSAKQHGNIHGSDPLARYFNPGAWAGKHQLTAVAAQQNQAVDAYERYREDHPPPVGGVALQEWTARQRDGHGLRDWLHELETRVRDGSASAKEAELFNSLLAVAADAVRIRYRAYAEGVARLARGDD